MFDLTPILMGDPSAACRRHPTAAEIERQERLIGFEPKRLGRRSQTRPPPHHRLPILAVGGELHGMKRSEAETCRAWLTRNKKQCTVRVQADGRYLLRRIA